MRCFNISSIEDISRRFGFEANQMLRAFAVVPRRASTALLRLNQSLFGHGAWQRMAGQSATSIFEPLRSLTQVTTTPATPVATLGVPVGNYSLNMPAYLDEARLSQVSIGAKCVGTDNGGRDRQLGQRDI